MSSNDKLLRRQGYLHIQNMEDLDYQRRLLRSRIDHQEIMVMYRLRCMWDFLSPVHLLGMGIRAVADHNRKMGIFINAITSVINFFRKRRQK